MFDLTLPVEQNQYYHISCMGQLFDLATLIEPKHLMMKSGSWATGFGNCIQTE